MEGGQDSSQGHGYGQSVMGMTMSSIRAMLQCKSSCSSPPSQMHRRLSNKILKLCPFSGSDVTDRRAIMQIDWRTALAWEVQLKFALLLPGHQNEYRVHSIKSGTLEGLVMRSGAVPGRLGFLLHWVEGHETIIKNHHEMITPPRRSTITERP